MPIEMIQRVDLNGDERFVYVWLELEHLGNGPSGRGPFMRTSALLTEAELRAAGISDAKIAAIKAGR